MTRAQADRYVKALFDAAPAHAGAFGFRHKYAHTQRVVHWANRLLRTERADAEVLLMAATFHDVGYTVSPDNHPAHGAEICEKYLLGHGFDAAFTSRVADCVRRHDDKALLDDPGTPMELILLIEADCLDETGAMSILRDALALGARGGDYRQVYDRLLERSIFRVPDRFPCATKTARNIWRNKQQFYFTFVKNLAEDLGEMGGTR